VPARLRSPSRRRMTATGRPGGAAAGPDRLPHRRPWPLAEQARRRDGHRRHRHALLLGRLAPRFQRGVPHLSLGRARRPRRLRAARLPPPERAQARRRAL